MRAPVLRIGGWPDKANVLWFIHLAREFSGTDLKTAKEWLDRLRAGAPLDLTPLNPEHTRTFGEQLLRYGVVHHAELVASEDEPPESILAPPPPPPPPVFLCPSCGQKMKSPFECTCGWLRFPGKRKHWGKSGGCPRCGFSYRWDGSGCLHCGFPVIVVEY